MSGRGAAFHVCFGEPPRLGSVSEVDHSPSGGRLAVLRIPGIEGRAQAPAGFRGNRLHARLGRDCDHMELDLPHFRSIDVFRREPGGVGRSAPRRSGTGGGREHHRLSRRKPSRGFTTVVEKRTDFGTPSEKLGVNLFTNGKLQGNDDQTGMVQAQQVGTAVLPSLFTKHFNRALLIGLGTGHGGGGPETIWI